MKLNLLSLSLGSYHVISHIYGFAKRDQGQPRKDNKLLYRGRLDSAFSAESKLRFLNFFFFF